MSANNIFQQLLELKKGIEPKHIEVPEFSPDPEHPMITDKDGRKKPRIMRTLGSVELASDAQRLYNPDMPPAPPKAPTAAQQDLGTAPSADINGRWGIPEKVANG